MAIETISPRQRVLDHYECVCATPGCGVSDPDLLCVDHVYGGGSIERRLTKKSSAQRYQEVIDDGFPKEPHPKARQLLCFNCHGKKTKGERKLFLEGRTLPANDDRVQIRLMVSADTDAYLTEMASAKHHKGMVVDDLYQSYKNISLRLDAIHAELQTLKTLSMPMPLHVVPDGPSGYLNQHGPTPLVDPYEVLKRAPPPQPPPVRVIKSKPSWWSRLWWKLFGVRS
jgi:hypothetical protein